MEENLTILLYKEQIRRQFNIQTYEDILKQHKLIQYHINAIDKQILHRSEYFRRECSRRNEENKLKLLKQHLAMFETKRIIYAEELKIQKLSYLSKQLEQEEKSKEQSIEIKRQIIEKSTSNLIRIQDFLKQQNQSNFYKGFIPIIEDEKIIERDNLLIQQNIQNSLRDLTRRNGIAVDNIQYNSLGQIIPKIKQFNKIDFRNSLSESQQKKLSFGENLRKKLLQKDTKIKKIVEEDAPIVDLEDFFIVENRKKFINQSEQTFYESDLSLSF